MANIAILHPQCVRLGGAIQMALRTAHALEDQGHTVTIYTFERSDDCFPDLQKGLTIEVWPPKNDKNGEKNTSSKLMNIATLAWQLRHVDTIIANNPPMQIVAALVKMFVPRIQTIWWHHHTPWYITTGLIQKRLQEAIFWKGILERFFIVPNIDTMIATSYFVAGKIQEYCGREAIVIHPVVILPVIERGAPMNDIVTLFTHGRLEPGKGLDMIVRVFRNLKQRAKCKEQKGGLIPVIAKNEAIHHTEESGAGITTQGDSIGMKGNNNLDPILERDDIRLIVFGTGSLESKLREQGVDVRPFDKNKTFVDMLSGQYGHAIGVYCSSIDAFGMASLECQMAGISTLILDRGGARETMLSSDNGVPVGYLVQSEDDLTAMISHYMEYKSFPEQMSNVNFYHTKDYFSTRRLSSDLLSVINKTDQ